MTVWAPRIQDNSRVKYVGIVEAIESDIKDRILKPGDKLPTQRYIAESLNVDLTTVTRAINEAAKRGFVDVVNRFDGNCFSCHAPAREKWDFICESGHGCDPIPIDHKMTGALQRSDPRCGEAEPEDGDWMALFKLKSMVTIGLTKKWIEDKL